MATMAEQAKAFRTATDQQYADLVNGRITVEQLIEANLPLKPTRKTMANIKPGETITLKFDNGGDPYTEPAIFLGDREDVDGRYRKFESFDEFGKSYTWEAYRFNGTWVYGTSAERLTVAQEV